MTSEEIKPAAPSASVILARDSDEGLEILMVRRHQDTAFGNADAFPGGQLSADDRQVLCSGIDAAEANQRLNIAAGGHDYYSAAIRELFEEVGVLLARAEHSHDIVNTDGETLARQRIDLVTGTLTWPQFLGERNLVLAADALHYISHWETPFGFPARFSTRFFVAAAPPDQQVLHDGRELVGSRWVSPSRALHMGHDDDLNLPFPTLKHVESLAKFSGLADLMRWARSRWTYGIPKVLGSSALEDGTPLSLLPGDPGYTPGAT